jgi:hypothetical protein
MNVKSTDAFFSPLEAGFSLSTTGGTMRLRLAEECINSRGKAKPFRIPPCGTAEPQGSRQRITGPVGSGAAPPTRQQASPGAQQPRAEAGELRHPHDCATSSGYRLAGYGLQEQRRPAAAFPVACSLQPAASLLWYTERLIFRWETAQS